MLKYMLIVIFFAGCSSGTQVQHYVGHVYVTSDQLDARRGFPSYPIEASYGEVGNTAVLYAHNLETGRLDTLRFLHDFRFLNDSIVWRWDQTPGWRTDIRRINDSLYISFGWGYGGESFYLRRDSL